MLACEGKRINRESPSTVTKVPCRPQAVSKKVKRRENSTAGLAIRRSNRETKRPVKYDYGTDPTTGGGLSSLQNDPLLNIKRKVYVKQPGRSCSGEKCFNDSPVNALSDALYSSSETSEDHLSGIPNAHITPAPIFAEQTVGKMFALNNNNITGSLVSLENIP